MRVVSFSRIAAAGSLVLSVTACGGSGQDDSQNQAADPQSGLVASAVAHAANNRIGSEYFALTSGNPDTGSILLDPAGASGALPTAPATPATGAPASVGSTPTAPATPATGAPASVGSTPSAPATPAIVGDTPVVTTSAPPTQPSVAYRRKVPMTAPVAVPTTFSGLHSHRWPVGSSPAPTYGYGTVRSLNFDPNDDLGILWYGINKADGQYDWSKMDQWVQTHYSAGKQLVYSLYGTPAWCSSNTRRERHVQPGGR